MRSLLASILLSSSIAIGTAGAVECPPDALGVSRTIVVDPTEHPRLGSMQYAESLPLEDHEVVLTFDDGPLPPYTSRVLDTLASQCVKATFFMVGRMARTHPAMVQRVHDEGHTIASHSQNHPLTFHRMSVEQAAREIEDGFESVRSALDDPGAVAPFFRFPGLLRQTAVEQYLADHDYMTWSLDFLADDWTHIKSPEIVRRAVSRIEARGRGILLLHDIHPATALALPEILRQLKERGFRIVHVVPASAERPKTATEPQQWATRHTPDQKLWPHMVAVEEEAPEPVLAAPNPTSFGIESSGGRTRLALAYKIEHPAESESGPVADLWPKDVAYAPTGKDEVLPIPAAYNFAYARPHPAAKPPSHRLSVKPTPRTRSPRVGIRSKRQAAADPIAALLGANPGKPVGHQLSVMRRPTNLNAPLQR